jgi:hypothetical protein
MERTYTGEDFEAIEDEFKLWAEQQLEDAKWLVFDD